MLFVARTIVHFGASPYYTQVAPIAPFLCQSHALITGSCYRLELSLSYHHNINIVLHLLSLSVLCQHNWDLWDGRAQFSFPSKTFSLLLLHFPSYHLLCILNISAVMAKHFLAPGAVSQLWSKNLIFFQNTDVEKFEIYLFCWQISFPGNYTIYTLWCGEKLCLWRKITNNRYVCYSMWTLNSPLCWHLLHAMTFLYRFRFPLSTVFCNIHRHYHHQHFLDANIGKEMNGHFSNVEKLVLKEKYIASEKWCRLQ